MTIDSTKRSATASAQDAEIADLYHRLLAAWNRRDPVAFAASFTEDGSVIGFDGSPVDGRAEIEAHIDGVFTHHATAAYVGKIREIRFLSDDVALVRAVAGMIPPGQSYINPAANAVQSLVAVRGGGEWRVALYHNTPAAFHGRPEASQALTDELRELLN